MRTKLFGAFIAALAIAAFAALPAGASAAAVTLSTAGRGNLVNGDSITGFSNNLEFGSGTQFVACTESEINGEVTANGVDPAEVKFENGGRFEGGGGAGRTGMASCPVTGTGGRVTARVRPNQFRSGLASTKTGGVISASTTVDFELLYHDTLLGGYFRECLYAGARQFTRVSPGKLKIRTANATLLADRFNTGCAAGGEFKGEFELTHEGEFVTLS